MTRVVLHPHLLPRSGPNGGARVYLPSPWRWWRTPLRECPDGALFHQSFDDPTDMHETSYSFNLLEVYDIVDPPAFHLIDIAPEYTDIGYGNPLRSIMSRGPAAEVEVVWYEKPGERWHALPGNTCRPGDYQVRQVDRHTRQEDDSSRSFYAEGMPPLRWNLVDNSPAGLEGARIAAAFGVPAAMLGFSEGAPSAFTLSGIESLRNGFVVQQPIEPPPDLQEQIETIYRARREYAAATADQPRAVLMNPADFRAFERQAMAQPDSNGRPLYERQFDGPATIMGLEVRIDAALPPGRIIIVGRARDQVRAELERFMGGSFGDPRREPQHPRIPGLDASRISAGVLSPNQIRELEGLPRAPVRRNILPESEVIDEIDRLVNEQLAPGPVDDYRINRYPKCPHCPHDWHGVLCDHCDCLGELEEET